MNAKIKTLALEEIKPQMRVKYWPQNECGTVSSKNNTFAFVKFDEQVSKFGWDGTTAKACSPHNLVALALLLLFALSSCDRSMNDSWLNPPSCHKKECMEADGYNIIGSPSQ